MMTLDEKLAQAAHDAHTMVDSLAAPPLQRPRMNAIAAMAAVVVVVLLLGGLGWLVAMAGDNTPVITQPTVTTIPDASARPVVFGDSIAFDRAGGLALLWEASSQMSDGIVTSVWLHDLEARIWREVDEDVRRRIHFAYDIEHIPNLGVFLAIVAESGPESVFEPEGLVMERFDPDSGDIDRVPGVPAAFGAGSKWVYDVDAARLLGFQCTLQNADEPTSPCRGVSAFWSYDPARDAWEDRTPELLSAAGLTLGPVVYDEHARKTVFFFSRGSEVGEAPAHAVVWTYDHATDAWEMRVPTPSPPLAALEATAAYAPTLGKVLLYQDLFPIDRPGVLWSYDTLSDVWEEVTIDPRADGGQLVETMIVTIDGTVIVNAPAAAEDWRARHLRSYDLRTGEWTFPPVIDQTSLGQWYRVDIEVPESTTLEDVLWDLAETPVGYLATGQVGLWISQDGIAWEPYARDVVDYGPGIAQIASSELGTLVFKQSSRDAWFSPDGQTWQAVEEIPSFRVLRSVAASSDGFAGSDQDGRSWYSGNGIDWQRSLADVRGDIEATPFGFFTLGEIAGVTRIWSSPDGKDWGLAAELEAETDETGLGRLAGSELGIVFVTQSGTVWYSADGTEWIEADTLGTGYQNQSLWAGLGASDSGFFASITRGKGLVDFEGWYSRDGFNWSPVPYDDALVVSADDEFPPYGSWVREVRPLKDGFLLVGEGDDGPVWIFEP